MKIYEIHDLTTGEILADNLIFDEVPELFGAYFDFYIDHEIIACYRTTSITGGYKIINIDEIMANNFKAEWLNLIEELTNLGNLY